ncbi:hypothetical protein CCUS01_09719 [Colletotrichum cuscutae]|uniref:Uncharacterized protein n=1 Tax=Colletotrichum cuscutae TaxID=1209917 RepID=A0AAI9UFX4_9PEZI|nr:hypothetical protein CCUS01_09719 [Colletotrichum cuscutae]
MIFTHTSLNNYHSSTAASHIRLRHSIHCQMPITFLLAPSLLQEDGRPRGRSFLQRREVATSSFLGFESLNRADELKAIGLKATPLHLVVWVKEQENATMTRSRGGELAEHYRTRQRHLPKRREGYKSISRTVSSGLRSVLASSIEKGNKRGFLLSSIEVKQSRSRMKFNTSSFRIRSKRVFSLQQKHRKRKTSEYQPRSFDKIAEAKERQLEGSRLLPGENFSVETIFLHDEI